MPILRRRRRNREQPVGYRVARGFLRMGIRQELRTNDKLTDEDRQHYEAALADDDYLEAAFQAAPFEFPDFGNADGSFMQMVLDFIRGLLEIFKSFGFIPAIG